MFELISAGGAGQERRATWPIIVSTAAHVAALTSIIVVSVVYVSERLPQVPAMMAFVAAPPPPPPPPPPALRPEAASAARTAPAANRFAAPVEAPSRVEPETGIDRGLAGGVPGGVEGGIPGGVIGGVVGGLPADVPPPPPPARRTPVRVGGMLQSPALVDRVAPHYPDLAVQARIHGTVILEATVDEDGHVREVRVLRSIPLLDAAALEAVRQWRYSPLRLNGEPQPFILTVTVTFNIADAADGRL